MISLFSGYGGLDLAVQRALGGARVVAVSDIDMGPNAVLAHRYPGAPNLKDITRIDWHALGHVDIMAGGFCCQSVSTAGRRAGLKRGTRTGLWFNYAEGIRICRPGLVIAANVGGLLTATSVCDEDDRRWTRRAGLLEKAGLCHCRTPICPTRCRPCRRYANGWNHTAAPAWTGTRSTDARPTGMR